MLAASLTILHKNKKIDHFADKSLQAALLFAMNKSRSVTLGV